MQCSGGHPDGATACAQDDPDHPDPDDPATFINTDVRNAFNETFRQTTFDTPAGAVWGQMGRAWLPDSRDSRRHSRPTQLVTSSDYVAFFCQFFGYPDNPVLAPIAQEPCRCQRYRHDSDHIKCCHHHSGKWHRAHEHVLRATMGVFQAAGYFTASSSMCPQAMALAVQISTLLALA